MGADLSSIANTLKNYYSDELPKEQQNLEPMFYDSVLGKSSRKPGGNGFIFSTHVSGNMAGGPMNTGDALNRAQNERTVQSTITPKHYHWPIEIDNAAKDATMDNAHAFARVVDEHVEEALRSFRKLLNQDAYGTGNSTRTTIRTAATTATLAVQEPWMVRENMVLDVYDSTLATRKSFANIVTGVSLNNRTVTVTTAVTVVVGDVLVLSDTVVGATGQGKSLSGLRLIVDDGTVTATFQNISRTTYPIWQANLVDASSAAVSNDLLQQTCDRTQYTTGKMMTDCLLSNPLQRRQYIALTTPMKRFMDDNLDSGFKVLEWNGLPWMTDTDCQRDRIWFLNKADLKRYTLRDLAMDDTGGSVFKWLQGYDKSFGYYILREDIGSERPNTQAQLHTLAVPTY